MISDLDECLICLEKCTHSINFECCGKYTIHDKCYKKWKETNKLCLICRSPDIQETNFILHYVTLARIKLLVTFYCLLMFVCLVYIVIICDFSLDYCELL
jgi:hypothetical protein